MNAVADSDTTTSTAEGRWRKIRAERAVDLAVPGDDDDNLLAEARTEDPVEAVIERLVVAERFPEAVKVLAFALPKREAVWWACVVARGVLTLSRRLKTATACLEAAEAWVYKPVEDRRQACYRAIHGADADAPAVLAAMAAAWSGGTLTPPDVEAPMDPIPPDDALTPLMVSNAVTVAAVMHEPENAPARFRRFLAQGRDIATGGKGVIDTASQ